MDGRSSPHIQCVLQSLAVGYADGFPVRCPGDAAHVLIGGVRCAVLGRVTMDQILVDVTKLPGVAAGDEAVLIGRQGDEEILAENWRKRRKRSPGISSRESARGCESSTSETHGVQSTGGSPRGKKSVREWLSWPRQTWIHKRDRSGRCSLAKIRRPKTRHRASFL